MAKATMCLKLLVLVMMFSSVYSDIAEDQKECGDELLRLSTCVPFIGGNTKIPAASCCNNLKQELEKTRKCLCLLVKDRNDPKLGIKVNATLALSLPSICHAPANVSQCPEILHLAPNSTDAQVFQQFASSSNSSAIVAGTPPSSCSQLTRKKWFEVSVAGGIISALIIGV